MIFYSLFVDLKTELNLIIILDFYLLLDLMNLMIPSNHSILITFQLIEKNYFYSSILSILSTNHFATRNSYNDL